MTNEQNPLQHLIDVWHRSAQDTITLLRSLEESDWAVATDLPGWDVRATRAWSP